MSKLADWGDGLELPRTRGADPWTSHAAGGNISRGHQLKTAYLVASHLAQALPGGLIDDELEARWGGGKRVTSGPRSRRAEMTEVGWVAKSGESRLTHNGEWAEVYVITLAGLEWYHQGPRTFQAEFRRRWNAAKKKPAGLKIQIDYEQ